MCQSLRVLLVFMKIFILFDISNSLLAKNFSIIPTMCVLNSNCRVGSHINRNLFTQFKMEKKKDDDLIMSSKTHQPTNAYNCNRKSNPTFASLSLVSKHVNIMFISLASYNSSMFVVIVIDFSWFFLIAVIHFIKLLVKLD